MKIAAENPVKLKNPIFKVIPDLSAIQIHILLALVGFLISRLKILNAITPFATPLAVAFGSKLSILFGIAAGLGTASIDKAQMYKYLASVVIVSVISRFTSSKKQLPFYASCVVLGAGIVYVFTRHFVFYDVITLLLEVLLTYVFCYIYKKSYYVIMDFKNRAFLTKEEIYSVSVIIIMSIAGISEFKSIYAMNVQNIISIFFILVIGYFSNVGISCSVGTAFGIACGLTGGNMSLFIGTYAFASLMSGIFAKFGKPALALGFMLGNIIVSITLAKSGIAVIGQVETAVALLIFIIVPMKIFAPFSDIIHKSLNSGDQGHIIKDVASMKLERIGKTFSKLSEGIMLAVTRNKNDNLNDLGTLYDSVAEKVCKLCALKNYCWQKEYDETVNALSVVAEKLKNGQAVNSKDFPDYFIKKCAKVSEVSVTMSSLYEIYRLNLIWKMRLIENNSVYSEQFSELSRVVKGLKEELEKNPCFDVELSKELAVEINAHGYTVKGAAVTKNADDKTEVVLSMLPCKSDTLCYQKITHIIKEGLGLPFHKTGGKCGMQTCKLTFTEGETYRVNVSVAQNTKSGEIISGDTIITKELPNGKFAIILCDGMGSGQKAHLMSSATASLLGQFLETGFSKSAAIKLINTSILTKTNGDFFSTIDLCVIDLKSGKADFMKKGMPPCFILRRTGKVETVTLSSLPAGVITPNRNEIITKSLYDGDILAFVSDGVYNTVNKNYWISDALTTINSYSTDTISDLLLKIAKTADPAINDDMTVVACKFERNDVEI